MIFCVYVCVCVREREKLNGSAIDDGERGKTYVDKDGLGVVNDDGIGGHVCRILCLFHFHLRQIKGCQCWSYLDGRRKIDLDLEF